MNQELLDKLKVISPEEEQIPCGRDGSAEKYLYSRR